MLCGCFGGKINVKTEDKSYETKNAVVNMQNIRLSGFSDKNFEETINNDYSKTLGEILDVFLKQAQEAEENSDIKFKMDIEHSLKYNKNGLLSIMSECYKYTGGVNGATTRSVKNIDTNTNTVLNLSDIFSDDEYVQMLNQKLKELSGDSKYSDLWEDAKIGPDQNEYFYFDDGGLVIFYPPYELSYYARGFVEFTIPYNDLYGYLKPEYSHLYNN